jgi:hypothetical protein
MVGPGKLNSTFFSILRWVARVIGSLVALLIVAFGVAYTIGGNPPPPLVFIAFAILVIGVILAWIWEGIGGGLLLLLSIVFAIVQPNAYWTPNENSVGPTPMLIFPIVAIIFIVCWLKSRSKPEILD